MGNNGNSDRLYFGGLQNHCSHEIKRHLLLWRKAMTKLDSILKSKDTTLLTKVHLIKALFFSSSHIWMWKLDYKESWEKKNWCFWIVKQLKKTLESLLDCKKIQHQSILKEISPEYPLEGLMLQLQLQYFDHLMRRTDSLEKTLMLGKVEGWRRTGQQRMRRLVGITDSMDMSLSKLRELVIEKPGMLQSMGSQWVRHDWSTELE